MPATSEPVPGSVIASDPIAVPASVGRTQRSTWYGSPALAMWGAEMPAVKSEAIRPPDTPA